MLDLTAKQQRDLRPTRASGTARAPTPQSARKLTRAFRGRDSLRLLEPLQRGVSVDVEPGLRPLRVAALEVIEAPTSARVAAASIETLAVAECMFGRASADATLTDVIVVARGVADAVEVKRRSLGYELSAQGGWTNRVFAITRDGAPRFGVQTWDRLRHAVCAATLEDYAEARSRAIEGWAERSAVLNARLAYAFPDEAWAEALLTAPASSAVVSSIAVGTPYQVAQISFLLSACRDPAPVHAIARTPQGESAISHNAMELALALPPEDAVSIFSRALPGRLKAQYKTPPRRLVAAMAAINTPSAAKHLAPYVGNRVVGALAASFFRDRPEHREALRGTNASAGARALAADLDEVDRLADDDTPYATASELPAVLRERAWRRPARSPKRSVVRGVNWPQPLDEHVDLPAVERGDLPLLEGERLEAWRASMARPAHGESGHGPVDLVYDYGDRSTHRVPPAEALAAWNAGRGWLAGGPLAFIAEHGIDAASGFVANRRLGFLDYEGADEWIEALSRLHSARAAPVWARIAAKRKRWRPTARRWMCRHAERAATGLIPAAVGPKGEAQKDAEKALIHLSRAEHSEAIREAAERYPEAVRAAVAQLLARDPRIVDVRPPKLPPFLRARALPPLLVESGARLSAEAVDDLLELLSVAPPEYAGFRELTAAFEPTSLDQFIVALVNQWAAADGPGRHDWMLRAAIALPGPLSTARVSQLARAWARSKQAPARRACDALASIGTDIALLHLGHIAATTRFKALQTEVSARLDTVALVRGLTRDELEDRAMPDLGLDERGRIELDFGETSLVVTLDGTLAVVLLDSEGGRMRSFPRGSEDDAERKAAKARYGQLKKEVKAIAARQRQRLERAMVLRREWSVDEARRYFFEHALGQHLARGLVWMSANGSFRVTEDGTLADAQDEEVTLPADAKVRVAHPLSLDDEGAWSKLFAEYELLQPFPQLGRVVHTPNGAERESETILRVCGRNVSARKVLGVLESRGWKRDGGSFVSAFTRPVSADVLVRITVEPGFEIAYLAHAADVSMGAARVIRDGEPGSLEDLDEVSFSEIVHELEALT